MDMKKIIARLFALIATTSLLGISACNTMDNGEWINPSGYYKDSFMCGECGQGESEHYAHYVENPFLDAAKNPASTFSIDADGAAYANMRRFISNGEAPYQDAVRIEEFLNYFTFDYPDPTDGENISISSELSQCPWAEGHELLRVGIKGKSVADADLPNENFVYLIDVSGSMSDEDKLPVLKAGFSAMADRMRATDKVAIVTYAGESGVLLQSTYGDEKSTIKKAISKLGAGGTTAGAEGLQTAYKIAEANYIPHGNNRIILGTDGDFNVGPSSTDDLVALIKKEREKGIYLTVIGVGTGNLNDNMMEQIADNGNGNYEYVDNAEQLEKVFVKERSKFYAVAGDSKVQITFDPASVAKYRLIGYENRVMDSTSFQKDSVDAGEIGAGQTITALYEIIPVNAKSGSDATLLAQFDFRYKMPGSSTARQLGLKIEARQNGALSIDKASENQRFAASVAAYGLILRSSAYAGTANKDMVLKLAEGARKFDPNGYREEYVDLVKRWVSLGCPVRKAEEGY
jgi:Ca-activated chloride channel family protein